MDDSSHRETVATEIDSALLSRLRELADIEGQSFQALIEEAIGSLLEGRQQGKVRDHVLNAHRESLAQFRPLYEKLAK
ncbi:MAG: hypothetical protein JF571_03230 [Asticcacaulis sp.]|nr:hypothetical protein [Asticcacaulis sp.]